MGVGKTTIGRLLADELRLLFHDSDEYLEGSGYGPGTEIASREGVARLHELELEVFLFMCGMPRPAVLAPGASVVDHEQGRRELEDNFTVWLTAPADVIAQRQDEGTHRRTISAEERGDLQADRAPLLAEVSVLTLDTGTISPNETVEKLIALLPESLRSSASG